RLHLAPRLLELGDRATVPTPAEHDQDRGEAAGGAAHDQPGAPETEARIEEQQRVEREKADRERRERPAERPHRTGWRRAGRTMNGEVATAASAASVVDSSSTCPPLNFTTWSCKGILRRFNAWVRAARFKSAIVVVGATVSAPW